MAIAKILAGLVLPSNLSIVLFMAAVLALCYKPLRRHAPALLLLSGLVVLVFSSGWTAAALMKPLQYAYPSLKDPARYPDVRHIVVLTGYASEDSGTPLSSRLNGSSLYRVTEALLIYERCPRCQVWVSGSASAARVMGKLMLNLGVRREDLSVDEKSETTADSARTLRDMLQGQSFFLVTSAGHMPRSVAVFVKQGARPITAPTEYLLPADITSALIRPHPFHLLCSDLAVHEYIGLIWYRLMGKI